LVVLRRMLEGGHSITSSHNDRPSRQHLQVNGELGWLS